MKNLLLLSVTLVVIGLLCVTNTHAQDKGNNKDLASLKSELAKAVEAGKLTKEQAVKKYQVAAAKAEGATKKSPKKFESKNSRFVEKLQALVSAGKLTEKEAKELYLTVYAGDGTKGKQPNMSKKKSDYKAETLKEQQKLSATLPTTSTAGDEEGRQQPDYLAGLRK